MIVKGIGKDGHIMSEEENKATKKSFTFDAAYDEQSTQKQFYEESCYPLVESVMEGFNGTIFHCLRPDGLWQDLDHDGACPHLLN